MNWALAPLMDFHAAHGIALDAISAKGVHQGVRSGVVVTTGPPARPTQLSGAVKVFEGMVSPPVTTVLGRV